MPSRMAEENSVSERKEVKPNSSKWLKDDTRADIKERVNNGIRFIKWLLITGGIAWIAIVIWMAFI